MRNMGGVRDTGSHWRARRRRLRAARGHGGRGAIAKCSLRDGEVVEADVDQFGITSVLQPNSRLILLPSGAAETLLQLSGQRMMFFGLILLS